MADDLEEFKIITVVPLAQWIAEQEALEEEERMVFLRPKRPPRKPSEEI
jgi:hypothetical protein